MEVVFRRIRGRIVPIKKKKKEDRGVQGAKLIGAGVAVTGSSFFAGKKLMKAEKSHQQAFDFAMDKPFSKLHPKSKTAGEQMLKASRSLTISKHMKKFSRVGGAALIGMGVERLSEKYGLDDNLGTEFASEVAGIGSAIGSEAMFRKGFGVSAFKDFKIKKISVPAGIANPIKQVGKDLASKFIKKQLRMKI